MVAKAKVVTEMQPKESQPFFSEVWNELSRIDVGDHIDSISFGDTNIPFLSWSWAWATLMSKYPESRFKVLPDEKFDDGSVMVNVQIIVIDKGRKASRTMYLPVMDRKNSAISNPGARNVSDTRMRCLVKCLALFGLGLDLWAKSDIPVGSVGDPLDDSQSEFLRGLYDRLKDNAKESFLVWAGVDVLEKLPKSKYQAARIALEKKLRAQSK